MGLKWATIGALALALAGCNLTATQVNAFCNLAADGTVLAIASTSGGAQASANKLAAVEVAVPCNPTLTAIGGLAK